MLLFQAEDGIRDIGVTGVQTCALPISTKSFPAEKVAGLDLGAADADLEELRRAAFADTLGDDRELGVARMTVRLLEWEKNYPKEGVRREEEWSEERARETEAARAKIGRAHV